MRTRRLTRTTNPETDGFEYEGSPEDASLLSDQPDGATVEAINKAREWFGSDDLVTEPQCVPWTPPSAVVQVGELVALEYASDKFDGTQRVYRHEFDMPRTLTISPDGSTLIVFPPFSVTERGIEG